MSSLMKVVLGSLCTVVICVALYVSTDTAGGASFRVPVAGIALLNLLLLLVVVGVTADPVIRRAGLVLGLVDFLVAALLAVNARRFLGSTGTFVLSGFFLLKGVLTLIVVRGTPARSDA